MAKDKKHEHEDAETIREKYSELKKKYNLPEFEELNEEFDIVKVDSNSETMLRDIRKSMMAKFSSILQFTELALNPANASMFYMYLVKGLNDKEKLSELFNQLGSIEIMSYERDVEYDEKKEAEFIIGTFKKWKQMQPDVRKMILSLKENWNKKSTEKSKSYFG